MAQLIDGKMVASLVRDQVKIEVENLIKEHTIPPHLAVILVGHNPASESYVRGKEIACQKAGIKSSVIKKEESITQDELIQLIESLNQDENIHGILLQLPIPKHLDSEVILQTIDSNKDVDGFTWLNIAKLTNGVPSLVPCTPLGVMKLLSYYQIPVSGKRAVVIGRSQIVGKPLASLLLKANATVTICHSKTENLKEVCQEADLLFAAIGSPNMITKDYVKSGAVVIDVGISKVDGVITGDVDYASVNEVASYLTPVPGGVGPMTIACLLENTLTCYKKLRGICHD